MANTPTQTAYELHALTLSARAEADTLTKRLFERCITPEVITTFQIEPRLNGWQYSTPGGGLRWKNCDSNANPKYQWLDGKSENASALYYAEDLQDQIILSGGVCWYVSGEPDVWAMRSAGISYAFSGFTEKAISPHFADFLQNMGVMLLYIAPDLDETGAAFARKIATALQGTGIELDCRQLPAELGERGDIGKAWQKHTSKIPFVYYLLGLPRWYPEPEKPKVETPLIVSTGEWGDIPADYRQRIMDACGVTKIGGLGYSNNVLCPIHKEEKPSAHFHEFKGLYCFHEMRFYKWVEVGAVLGIDPFKKEKPTVILSSPQMAVEAQRELIRLKLTALCRLLDELYLQGFKGGEVLTVKELQAACVNLSLSAIRQAMKQAEGKGKNSAFLWEIFPSYARSIEGKKTLKNTAKQKTGKPKGRPAKRFHVPDLQRLYKVLNVQPETIQTIPSPSRKDPAQYRAEVMAAKIRHKAGEYAIVQLAKPLGITAPTVRAYCKRANIEVTPRFDKTDMLTESDIDALPVDSKELAEWRRERKFKGAVWLETLDGKCQFTPTQEGAARAGHNGRAFRLVKQLANHYKASEKPLFVTPAIVSPSQKKVTPNSQTPSVTKPTAQPSKADELRKADFEKIVTAYREKMGEPPTKTVKEVLREWQNKEYGLLISMGVEETPDEQGWYDGNAFIYDSPDPLREWEKRRHELKKDPENERPLPFEDGWAFPVEPLFSYDVGTLFYYYKMLGGELNREAVRFMWDEQQKTGYWIISETLREMLERQKNGGEIRNPFAYLRKVVNEKHIARDEEFEDEE